MWKWGLIATAAVVALLVLWSWSNVQRALDPALAGSLGVTYGEPGPSNRLPITALEPGLPMAAAGARIGNEVIYDHVGSRHRALGTDELIGLTLYADGQSRHVQVKPAPTPGLRIDVVLVDWVAGTASSLIALVVAILLALRRADSPPMRALSLALLLPMLYSCYYLPEGVVHDVVVMALWPLAGSFGTALFLFFALSEPTGRPALRHAWVRWLFWVTAITLVVYGAAGGLQNYRAGSGTLPAWHLPAGIDVTVGYLHILSMYAGVLALWVGWRASSGATRQRLAWLLVAIGGRYLLSDTIFWLRDWGVWPLFNQWTYAVYSVTSLISMALLGYAILRHRILEFRVVVQRALVFSAIAALIAMTLGAGKWAVERFLLAGVPHGGWLSQLLPVIVVVLAFSRLQHWVVERINRIFFRSWRQAADALRHAIEVAVDIGDPDMLRKHVIDAVERYSAATGGALYEADTEGGEGSLGLTYGTLPGAPARLDRNDELMAALHHGARRVELRQPGSTASAASPSAEWAFPTSVRGGVAGLLLLGSKENGTSYRGEELELLAASAMRVGLCLESLRVAALQREREELLAQVAQMRSKLASQEDTAGD
ncbi:MAG: hypothetical protein IPF94_06360 [Betaproteobacteria bacterium]|nr:hypothetical protein [Betaproteobacteria bacterium]